MGKTIIEKIWQKHLVTQVTDGPDALYIDRQYIHEVTSPQAFDGLRQRGIKVFRPESTLAVPDHNVPTMNQHLPIVEELSRFQVNKLIENTKEFGIRMYGLGDPNHGIVHVIGPEMGVTQPGMTIVCGDSHTSTHGAFGAIAFGIGTSELEMVFASQCLLQYKPKQMQIVVNGMLSKGVTAKDLILYIIAKLTAGGGTGYFIEFAGSAIKSLSMEARMTVCNMSIEMGAKGGLIAPDDITFNYLKGRDFAPKGADWDKAVAYWKQLPSDADAKFDIVHTYDAADIEPMITYGTNPGMGMKIGATVPTNTNETYIKSLNYMGINAGEKLVGKTIDYVFLGSCTNGRIEDFREFTAFVKGKKKAENVIAWLVPGSKIVENQIIAEGLDKTLHEAGFELRQPGCSACLAMNEDKVPAGKYCVATSNRNFEGRQGPGARTMLVSPLSAAAAALTGKITDPRELM